MDSGRKRSARIAGLWYLAMVLSGPIGIMYVPSEIVVAGDAGATLANIRAHELLLRIGIASSLFCQVSFVFLVMALHRLFQGVSDTYSKLMVALVLVAVPIAVTNELCQLAALELGTGSAYLNALPDEQRGALALASLNVHAGGISVASIFWGLWLLPFGMLVIRSGFIPRILGILLIVGCFSYLVDGSVPLLLPEHRELVSTLFTLPLAAGELSMMLWLLIKGVRKYEHAAPAA